MENCLRLRDRQKREAFLSRTRPDLAGILADLLPTRLRNLKEAFVASRVQDCDDCARLWDAYANATFKRVRAENVLNRATALYEEPDTKQALKRDVEEAVQLVEQRYKALAQHEAIAHGRQSLRMSASV